MLKNYSYTLASSTIRTVLIFPFGIGFNLDPSCFSLLYLSIYSDLSTNCNACGILLLAFRINHFENSCSPASVYWIAFLFSLGFKLNHYCFGMFQGSCWSNALCSPRIRIKFWSNSVKWSTCESTIVINLHLRLSSTGFSYLFLDCTQGRSKLIQFDGFECLFWSKTYTLSDVVTSDNINIEIRSNHHWRKRSSPVTAFVCSVCAESHLPSSLNCIQPRSKLILFDTFECTFWSNIVSKTVKIIT